MLALGDAIAMLASKMRGFAAADFAKFHPGGALGRKLTSVNEIMRPIDQCRVADDSVTVREAISNGQSHRSPKQTPMRRSGAVMLVNSENRLTGIFTDSDLVRLLQERQEQSLDRPIAQAMTRKPVCILRGKSLGSAVELLSQRHLSELPVIDENEHPIGMIDITDLIAAGDVQTGAPRSSEVAPSPQAFPSPRVIRFPNHTTTDGTNSNNTAPRTTPPSKDQQ
jgi:arabinose-5-phosphate isomerase